jgi:hypothetical protein
MLKNAHFWEILEIFKIKFSKRTMQARKMVSTMIPGMNQGLKWCIVLPSPSDDVKMVEYFSCGNKV